MDAWRAILKRSIEDPKEKRRIADMIGVLSARTLDRWAEGTSTPKNNQVIRKLGSFHPELDEELRKAFPETFLPAQESSFPRQQWAAHGESPEAPPREFYARVLHAYTTIPPTLKLWTISNLVLGQMIRHLDPDSSGIVIVFAQCLSGQNTTVNALLARESGGNGLWETRQLVSQQRWESGSIVGAAASGRRPYVLQAFPLDSPYRPEVASFFQQEHIASLAVYPVQREGALAGVLLVGASTSDFFLSSRRTLLEEYAQLYSLAFSDHDFSAIIALANGEAILSTPPTEFVREQE